MLAELVRSKPVEIKELLLIIPVTDSAPLVEHDICAVGEKFLKLRRDSSGQVKKPDADSEELYERYWNLVNTYGKIGLDEYQPRLNCPDITEMMDDSVNLYTISLGVSYSDRLSYGHDSIGLHVRSKGLPGRSGYSSYKQTLMTFSKSGITIWNARSERFAAKSAFPLITYMATCLEERYARIASEWGY